MGISDSQGQLFYNESYFRFVVVQGNVSRDGLSLDFNGYVVETKEWDSEILQYVTQKEGDDPSATRCLKHENYTMSGAYASKNYEYLSVNVWRCSPLDNITWASDAEIDANLNGGRLNFVFLNSYVDFDDYDTVIKTYSDERYALLNIFHIFRSF